MSKDFAWGRPGDYVNLESDRATLDGDFTANELRQIADEMDKLRADTADEELGELYATGRNYGI